MFLESNGKTRGRCFFFVHQTLFEFKDFVLEIDSQSMVIYPSLDCRKCLSSFQFMALLCLEDCSWPSKLVFSPLNVTVCFVSFSVRGKVDAFPINLLIKSFLYCEQWSSSQSLTGRGVNLSKLKEIFKLSALMHIWVCIFFVLYQHSSL